jgi:hypothetical protein
MLRAEYLRHQSDALLRLSQEVGKSEVSAKLQEMADEFRIMISVADVTSLAADLNRDGLPCAGFRNNYPSVGDENGSGHGGGPPGRMFSFAFLRSRRRARRAFVA